MHFLSLSLAGFGIGVVVGLTGTGAASLVMATLVVVLGMPAGVAVGTTIAAAAVPKLSGSFEHCMRRTVDWRIVLDFALGSVPGAIVAGVLAYFALAAYPHEAEAWIKRAIAVFIILAAVLILGRNRAPSGGNAGAGGGDKPYRRGLLRSLGALAGFAVATTSIGAGTLTKGILVMTTRLDARKLVGTDLVHGTILALTAACVYGVAGSVAWVAVLGIAVGAIPGGIVGGKLAVRAPIRILQVIVAAALVVVGVKLLMS